MKTYDDGVKDGLQIAWIRIRSSLADMHLALGPLLFDIDRTVTLYEIQSTLDKFRNDIRNLLEKT